MSYDFDWLCSEYKTRRLRELIAVKGLWFAKLCDYWYCIWIRKERKSIVIRGLWQSQGIAVRCIYSRNANSQKRTLAIIGNRNKCLQANSLTGTFERKQTMHQSRLWKLIFKGFFNLLYCVCFCNHWLYSKSPYASQTTYQTKRSQWNWSRSYRELHWFHNGLS